MCVILDGAGYDMATAHMAWEIMRSIDWMVVTQEHSAQLPSFFLRSCPTVVFSTEGAPWSEPDGKKSFLSQPFVCAVPHLRTPPSRASVRRAVAKYSHHTYQRPLIFFSFMKPFFSKVPKSLQTLGGIFSVVRANTGRPANEYGYVERGPTTKAMVASSSSSTEVTMPLDEGSIGTVSSASPASYSSSPSTLVKTSSQPEISSLLVGSLPKISFVPALSVSLGNFIGCSSTSFDAIEFCWTHTVYSHQDRVYFC